MNNQNKQKSKQEAEANRILYITVAAMLIIMATVVVLSSVLSRAKPDAVTDTTAYTDTAPSDTKPTETEKTPSVCKDRPLKISAARLYADGAETLRGVKLTVNDAVAKRISKLLCEKNMSQYRLEQESGIQHGSMQYIMNGRNKTVTLSTVILLARGFHMSLTEFLDDELFRSEDLEAER